MSRVLSFGCSHACGCEIEGPGIAWSKTNIESSFGNLVAKHFNKEFKLSARPGSSNRQIFLNVLEHVQPGDICLLSWTYFNRENWFADADSDKIRSDVFNAHEMLRILELNNMGIFQHVTNKFHKIPETPTEQLRSGINLESQYLQNHSDKTIVAVANAWDLYHSNDMVRVFDFLESFHSANAIIKQRGATAVNFHFAEDQYYNILNKVNTILTRPYKHDFYTDFGTPEYCLVMPLGNDLKIFDEYINNQDFIKFYNKTGAHASFKYWYCEKELGDPYDWPGDRMGHLDAKAHKCLADYIINKLQSNTGKLEIF